MQTRVIKVKDARSTQTAIAEAAKLLRHGDIVAFPTETVYGLGADAFSENAVKKIFAAKGRPADNPLIVHIADPSDLRHVAREVKPAARKLMGIFWPGPLSIVLPKHAGLPAITTAGLDTVVVRLPKHPIARSLIKASGTLIAAPSANISGKVSPTTAEHVLEDLNGKISLIIDGGTIEYGLESTVIDCTEDTPIILRPGSITEEMLRLIIPDITASKETGAVRAPGMKYQHYAPEAPVILFTGEASLTAVAISSYAGKNKNCAILWHTGNFIDSPLRHRLPEDPEKAVPKLFAALRALDKQGPAQILVQGYDKSGIGTAIMNRLEKAALEIIQV